MSCAFCHSRPAAHGHPYCGRRCAAHAAAAGWNGGTPPPTAAMTSVTVQPSHSPAAIHPPPTAAAVATHGAQIQPANCALCHKRPAAQGHPFCGRYCAGQAAAVGFKPPPSGAALAPASVLPTAVPVAISAPQLTVGPPHSQSPQHPAGGSVAQCAPQSAAQPPPGNTYCVCFPFNPAAVGMVIGQDLSIVSVTPGGIEDQAGVL